MDKDNSDLSENNSSSDINECNTSECNINDTSSSLNSTNLSHRLTLLRKIVHDLREDEDEENQVFGLQLRGGLRKTVKTSVLTALRTAPKNMERTPQWKSRTAKAVESGNSGSAPVNPPRKPTTGGAYANVRARVRVRRGRPVTSGFANVGSVFDTAKGEELHPQVIKMARKSGQLNLSNRGMIEIPDKVYHLHEIDNDEAKDLTMGMSMDNSNDDCWWEQSDLTRLYLSSNTIQTVDPKISNLGSLQILDLSDNQLQSLPSTMGELNCLTRLNLSHNKLEDLPCGLFALPELRSLQLDYNKLTSLPNDIGNLTVLEYLDVSNNELITLPPNIGYVMWLSKFNASNNKIKTIPEELGDLHNLTQLDLTKNELEELPKSIGDLKKLEQLYLRHNRLKFLPPLHSCQALKELHLGNNLISEMTAEQLKFISGVSVLDLRDNKLEDLPDVITVLQGLERLDLTNNNLATLPFHIAFLPHLKSLSLEGNGMRQIRRDIIQRGTVQLLKYLRSRISEPINTFPGFENTPVDNNQTLGEKPLPDKYQMRNTQILTYNEKASEIPEIIFEHAAEAEVRSVDLSKNILTELPEKIELLSSSVKELLLSTNKLSSLPSYLGNFKKLQFLDLQVNQLNDLPQELVQCPYLREINIAANRFEELPSCIFELKALEILVVADNRLQSINVEGLSRLEKLATLDLHNNSIDFVPLELGNITQLKTLLINGNPFRVPRTAIIEKGTQEILSYLRSRIVME
ncbi:unnamed protein product, partial [Meganyctiphanes norvegica]